MKRGGACVVDSVGLELAAEIATGIYNFVVFDPAQCHIKFDCTRETHLPW